MHKAVATNARHDARIHRVYDRQLAKIDMEREVERVRAEVGYASSGPVVGAVPRYEHFPKIPGQSSAPHDVYFRRGLYEDDETDSAEMICRRYSYQA
jgi:hypothetical protein